MRVFFGGQIKEGLRGDLAAVVARDETLRKYNSFLYPINSEEFVHLTGIRAVCDLPDRVYIGLSQNAGELIVRETNDKYTKETLDLRNIDALVVIPHFLEVCQEKPERIVLESTRDGYEVVEAE
jgi:hypothetical protein